MIAVVDYGMGNLRSVEKALGFLGHGVAVTGRAADIEAASGVVLPGVGSFGDAMQELSVRGMVEPIRAAVASGVPLLGICLGYQLVFEHSEESPGVDGIGILPGRVLRFPAGVKIPHTGWNDARRKRDHPVLAGVEEGAFFYFVHSYYVQPEMEENELMTTAYGIDFASGAAAGSLVAFQFHPEKSSAPGMRILDNFARQCV